MRKTLDSSLGAPMLTVIRSRSSRCEDLGAVAADLVHQRKPRPNAHVYQTQLTVTLQPSEVLPNLEVRSHERSVTIQWRSLNLASRSTGWCLVAFLAATAVCAVAAAIETEWLPCKYCAQGYCMRFEWQCSGETGPGYQSVEMDVFWTKYAYTDFDMNALAPSVSWANKVS